MTAPKKIHGPVEHQVAGSGVPPGVEEEAIGVVLAPAAEPGVVIAEEGDRRREHGSGVRRWCRGFPAVRPRAELFVQDGQQDREIATLAIALRIVIACIAECFCLARQQGR